MTSTPLTEMRRRLLEMNPSELQLAPTDTLPNVWGLLMETGYSEGPVTLLSIADGATSLYLPTGGGVIGAGEHAPVRAAGEAFLKTAEFALSEFRAGADRSSPNEGDVSFLALTYRGVLCTRASEETLGSGVGPLSALFFAGQALLSQVPLASSKE